MSKLTNMSTNRIVDREGKLDFRSLKNLLDKMIDRMGKNIFDAFDGRYMSVIILNTVTNLKVSHNLNFIPNFAIIGYQSNSTSTVTLNYSKFDNTNIDVTTTGPVEFKVLLGRFDE